MGSARTIIPRLDFPAAATAAGAALLALALAPSPAAASRPNVVLIATDDQPRSLATKRFMPNTVRLLGDRGTRFKRFFATTPRCCPSRAATLTGQYGHNNGVLRNRYIDLRAKRNVLPTWLSRAGYTTAHVGKFMNQYEKAVGRPTEVAPGWDKWFTLLTPLSYYGYDVSVNGRRRSFGKRDRDHATRVLSARAARLAGKLARRRAPFFLQLNHFAPHHGGGRDRTCPIGPAPAPRDAGRFSKLRLPRKPSIDERDVSDKPRFIRRMPRMSSKEKRTATRIYRCMAESVRGVDRGVKALVRALKEAGELNRTAIFFTSDNGYFFGEHRIRRGKRFPYEENIRMPLLARIPAAFREGPRPRKVAEPVANIDLAPTILELAGGSPCLGGDRCRTLDGRSLLGLLGGTRAGWPRDRGIGLELGGCAFRGVRTASQVYIEHATKRGEGCGERIPEHYRISSDRFQLDNLAPAPAGSASGAAQARLQRRVRRLSRCAGIAGRDARTEDRPWCD